MDRIEWPGITTAVGIVAITAIALDLSKWQQLTAGLLAFGGGLMAYRGAMSKVDHDREESRRALLRKQLSLYLKLDMAVRRLKPTVQLANVEIGFASAERPIQLQQLRLKEPLEFGEAWEALDVFPRSIIRQIAIVRDRLRDGDDLLNEADNGVIVLANNFNEPGNPARHLYELNDAIIDACVIIESVLAPEIERLAPDTPDVDKQILRYGSHEDE